MDGVLTDAKISSNESSPTSVPEAASETSRGSSVSSDLQREYEDILKYAIVTPRFNTEVQNIYQQVEGKMLPRPHKNLSTISEVSSTEASFSNQELTEGDDNNTEVSNEHSDEAFKNTPVKEMMIPISKGKFFTKYYIFIHFCIGLSL